MGEHERPHPPTGRARPGRDDGTYTQIPEALFFLVGRIVPSEHTAAEMISVHQFLVDDV